MSESVAYSDGSRVERMVDGSQSTMPTLANSPLTNDTFIEESGLNNDQKKRKWRIYTLAEDGKRLMNMR